MVWTTKVDDQYTSWGSRFVGSAWYPAQLLSPPFQTAFEPSVAIAGNGVAFAAWLKDPGTPIGRTMVAQFR